MHIHLCQCPLLQFSENFRDFSIPSVNLRAFCHEMFSRDVAFLLTVGGFLLAVELLCLQLYF